jgi:hypothetical protein
VDRAELERRRERAERRLRLDPLDVEAVESGPPPRQRLATLEAPPGSDFAGARFLPDGGALLVSIAGPARSGDRRFDLYRWTPGRRAPERLTRGGGLVDPDPFPDGRRAAALAHAHGASSLVAVDLTDGSRSTLVASAPGKLYDQPRVAPDGHRLAYLEHRSGAWRAVVRDLATGAATEPPLPLGGEPMALAWRRDGSLLYAAVARAGAVEIEALPVAPGALWHQVTRGEGVALAPEPAPDGTALFHLRLDVDGFDLARLSLDAATLQPETAPVTAMLPPVAAAAAPPAVERSAFRPYGAGRLSATPLVGGFAGSDSGPFEIGLRAGDRLGRIELLGLAALGGGAAGPSGERLSIGTRALPVALSLHAARVEGARGAAPIDGAERLTALELDGRWVGYGGGARGAIRLDLAAGLTRIDREGDARPETDRALLDVGLRAALGGGTVFRPSAGLTLHEPLGGRGEPAWRAARLGLELVDRRGQIALEAERREAGSGVAARVRLGGAPSSLLPSGVAPERWAHPALPEAALLGERIDRIALRLSPGRRPYGLFAERYSTGSARLRLVGVEGTFATGAIPFLGVPALELRGGAARVLDGALDGETRWWLGLVYSGRPLGEARFP